MVESRVERRLAAILAADVVGYSRMMGADEAGTLARLKSLRVELIDPMVAEYGGRVVKTMGDGLLIEFPSAVDAVQHAVEMQNAIARRNADIPDGQELQFRIGINIGDVIVDGGDIYGDGINVAARLEEIAEPGGIAVSGMVYESVRNRLGVAFEARASSRSRTSPTRFGSTGSRKRWRNPRTRPRRQRTRFSASRRSPCCPSPTCRAMRNRTISPTG